MTKRKVSFLVPSKGRAPILKKMLKSVLKKSGDNLRFVEVVVLNDEDEDHDSYKAVLNKFPQIDIKHIVKTVDSTSGRLNECASVATGKILCIACDDITLRSSWYDYVMDGFDHHPDHLACVFNKTTNVVKQQQQVSICFIHRQHYDILGWVIPNITSHYMGDDYMYQVYYRLDRLYMDKRIKILHDNKHDSVFHAHADVKGRDLEKRKIMRKQAKTDAVALSVAKKKRPKFSRNAIRSNKLPPI